ncbi:MAG: hypothetical protein WAL50_18615, partial [Kineosporiaceae bacterium]
MRTTQGELSSRPSGSAGASAAARVGRSSDTPDGAGVVVGGGGVTDVTDGADGADGGAMDGA